MAEKYHAGNLKPEHRQDLREIHAHPGWDGNRSRLDLYRRLGLVTQTSAPAPGKRAQHTLTAQGMGLIEINASKRQAVIASITQRDRDSAISLLTDAGWSRQEAKAMTFGMLNVPRDATTLVLSIPTFVLARVDGCPAIAGSTTSMSTAALEALIDHFVGELRNRRRLTATEYVAPTYVGKRVRLPRSDTFPSLRYGEIAAIDNDRLTVEVTDAAGGVTHHTVHMLDVQLVDESVSL